MTLVAVTPVVTRAQSAATKPNYHHAIYKSPLKKSDFSAWYRGIRAMIFLLKAGPAIMAANDKWFEENKMTEGAYCGRRKNL